MDELIDLQAVFRQEAQELTDQVLTALDTVATAHEAQRQEVLKTVKRHVHNLKGAAGSVGHDAIAEVCHGVEELIGAPRFVTQPSAGGLDAIVEAVEQLQLVVAERSPASALRGHVERLRSLAPSAAAAPAPAHGPASAPVEAAAGRPDAAPREVNPSPAVPATPAQASIRVAVDRLDSALDVSAELMAVSGRMQATTAGWRALVKELTTEAQEHAAEARWLAPWLGRASALARRERSEGSELLRLVADLSEAMKSIRMVPLQRFEGAWRGIVRETARVCGKRVQLSSHVGDIELDRDILDALQDPLMHILRNAVDHGVEPEGLRLASGKPAQGELAITAATLGTWVELEVSDDGRGLDYERIRQRAIDTGLLAAGPARELAPAALAELIFAAGFSTAAEVSSVSGRGIGLDVARAAIDKLGGTITVSPEALLGGTTFRLVVPASRISTAGLFVRGGATVCALPLEGIERVVRVRREQVQGASGQPLVSVDGLGPVRPVTLSSLLGRAPVEAPPYLVVVERGSQRVGLLVDEILGEDVFVTTSLPWNVGSIPGVAGAIRRPDGSLALALEVSHLFALATSGHAGPEVAPAAAATSARRILVADDALTVRVFEESLLHAAGYEVVVAEDGAQAWALLEGQRFDLVLTDIEMPGIDGLELTRRIRDREELHDLPVILVSSRRRPEDRAAGAAAGADEYLVKGAFQGFDLLATIRRFLGGARP